MNFPIIKTKRCLLRKLAETDLENIFKGLSHPDIIKYYGVSYTSLEETKKQLEFFDDLRRNETGIWWAVCSLENDIFYGAAGLNSWSKEHKKAEIGYWLLKDFWGDGIITEIIPAICNYGFNSMDLHRIEAMVETENRNSITVMNKTGFQLEGTMRECEIKNGKWISLDIYAKLKPVE